MSYFDLVFAVLLLWAAYKGFSKGFVKSLASLVALVLGVWGAIRFSGLTTTWLESRYDSEYLPLIAFAITFVLIVVAIHFLALLLDKLLKSVSLGTVNSIFGLLFGLLKSALIISVLLVLLNNFHKKYPFLPEEQLEKSYLYLPLSGFAPLLFPYLNFKGISSLFDIEVTPKSADDEPDTEKPAEDSQTEKKKKRGRKKIDVLDI